MPVAKGFLAAVVVIASALLPNGLVRAEPAGPHVTSLPRDPSEAQGRQRTRFQAIAFVSIYDDAEAARSLDRFSQRMGLPKANYQVIRAAAPRPAPANDCVTDDSIDIQMAYLAAPDAKLYLVEAASSDPSSVDDAVAAAYRLVVAAGGGKVTLTQSLRDEACGR